MEIKLTVRAEIIAALKLFAANKDERQYLNGIALEIGATESRLVATNGYILGCIRIVSEQPEVTTPLTNIIIPNDLLKSIKPVGMVEITIGDLETEGDEKSNSRQITLTYAGVSISGKTIDGVFPDYRRIIPPKVSGQTAQFNPSFICILAKAASIIHGGKGPHYIGIGHNGEGPALIDLGYADFTGVLMPLRPDSVPTPVAPPSWLTNTNNSAGTA